MPTNMNMNVFEEERNRGYVLAGIAALVAIISFFFLPYVNVVLIGFTGAEVAEYSGFLWLELTAALVAIALSALLIFRSSNPFGSSTTPPATQIRRGVNGLIGAGAVGLLVHMIALVGSASSLAQLSPFGVSFGFGFWVYLLAMIGVIVGGVIAKRTAWIFPPSQLQGPPQQQQQQQSTQNPPLQQQYPPSQASKQQGPPQQQQPPRQ